MQGYIEGLEFCEVSGLDADGNVIAILRTRFRKSNAVMMTNKQAREELKEVYGAVKFKRRNVWKFTPVEV